MFYGNHQDQSNLLQYLADVLDMDNYAIVQIEDVWKNPEGMMKQIAEFLEVPWTPKFLKWEVSFYMLMCVGGKKKFFFCFFLSCRGWGWGESDEYFVSN